MTSVFSWQNSVRFYPASFCTPRPNLPVTPGISSFPTFAFQFPVVKRTSFLVLVLEGLVCPSNLNIKLFKFSFFGISGWDIELDYCDIEWFALEMNRGHFLIFKTAPKYCISDFFVDYRVTPFLLRDSCPL